MNTDEVATHPETATDRQAKNAESATRLSRLEQAVEHAAHLLPAQGPITVFIHHNTLHAFEESAFADGVMKGAKIFGCQPYLPEDRYREKLGRGRIRFAHLETVLREDLGDRADEKIDRLCSRFELRLAMLQYPLRFGPTEELLWFMAETDALRKVRRVLSAAARECLIAETRRWVMRDLRGGNEADHHGVVQRISHPTSARLSGLFDSHQESRIETWNDDEWESFTLQALWRQCCDGIARIPVVSTPPYPVVRHRDLLLRATGVDIDLQVNEVLIRFCAAFLDQGFARWPLPQRDQGFYVSFRALYGQSGGPPAGWLRAMARELVRPDQAQVTPLQSMQESLSSLGIAEAEWETYISATLLALPGWAGMIQQIELRGDRVVHPIPKDSLVEFLAIRLLLERHALAEQARELLGYSGSLEGLREVFERHLGTSAPLSEEQRAFQVFQLAQVLGWAPPALHSLTAEDWTKLLEEIESFSNLERRRIFHLAYERRFVTQTLDAFALHRNNVPARTGPPRFQACFCLDEREESIRRNLEEGAPGVVTFGAAAFYGVAMYYRGASDAHFVPLCPIIIRPQHWVTEQVDAGSSEIRERRARTRWILGTASHQFHVGSRTFALGALLTAGLGVLAAFPLVARVLFPRTTARIRKHFNRFVQTPLSTRLQLERSDPTPSPEYGHVGYNIDEMTSIAERQIRDIGLTSGFARLVFFVGHGSFSLNNPHKSAYHCGACGGSPGAPNGRALAQMLNDPRVRERLVAKGLSIPADTIFVGSFHNTCNDTIAYFDVDRVPASHLEELQAAQRDFEIALDRNAHERCRRFMSAPLTLSFAAARQHVEARAEDLAQTRPELGHATNALCPIGRRERTRGLFLDRRAFLTSYDPTQDDAEAAILTRILQAAVPVCAGISLEYYFSRVDNGGWGCGTKLPHNISALLGVMDGAASDLRTGLPLQMVEIHEPMRLLFIIETTQEIMLRIMDKNPEIGRVFRNGWALLAVQDPESGALRKYRDGIFHPYHPEAKELPRADSSVDWYRGWRDHLDFAEIGGTSVISSI